MVKPEALLLDFNGVIVDDEPVHHRAAVEVLAPLGVEVGEAEYFERYLGLPDHRFFRQLFEDRGLPLPAEALDKLMREKAEAYARRLPEVRLVGGAAEALADLASQVPVGIVSGALRAEIDAVLAKFGLGHAVRTIVSAEDVPRGKPDPDGYLLGLERLGVRNPALCLAVEDAPAGVRAARAAGLDCWALTTSRAEAELRGASRILASLEGVSYATLELVEHRLVVAAVLEGEAGFLLCRRPEGGWEFPGGKVEPGETAAAALARELLEELRLPARIGRELGRTRWSRFELVFLETTPPAAGWKPSLHYYPEVAWTPWAELGQRPLLEADRLFVEQRNREAASGERLS